MSRGVQRHCFTIGLVVRAALSVRGVLSIVHLGVLRHRPPLCSYSRRVASRGSTGAMHEAGSFRRDGRERGVTRVVSESATMVLQK